MSDNQRIRGLGGIKPSRMPVSAAPEITVMEAEKRLGIEPQYSAQEQRLNNTESITASRAAVQLEGFQESMQDSQHEQSQADLPASLRNRKPRELTISKTFRLPLGLVTELERVSSIHDLPMVTILAEALEIHLARFPR